RVNGAGKSVLLTGERTRNNEEDEKGEEKRGGPQRTRLACGHFESSSRLLIASSRRFGSIFATPGSAVAAYTLLPLLPNATFSSFFPSSNLATTVSVGESTPVPAREATNDCARISASPVRRASIFSLSASAADGRTRFHVSAAPSLPLTRSKATVL